MKYFNKSSAYKGEFNNHHWTVRQLELLMKFEHTLHLVGKRMLFSIKQKNCFRFYKKDG